jgi:hypothetical protein
LTTLLAQIAPQRSTQYADLAAALAPHELRLSPLGARITAIEPLTLGGQGYLRLELGEDLDAALTRELGMFATVNAFFELHDRLGGQPGPWLRPVETGYTPHLPTDLVMARRYKGKTNEMFTQFLLNVARHSSRFAAEDWASLRVIDPLAGGGTTLLVALTLGAHAAGVEKSLQDVQTTAAFLQRYAREKGIACRVVEERLRGIGRRWWLTLGKAPNPQQCMLAQGETARADALLQGFRQAHLIVGDLPYGIQHQGVLTSLLQEALPVWTGLLLPGGALALAWDATRFSRGEMVALVAGETRLTVLDDSPYDALAHRVDRVIRKRDVLVARRDA